MDKDIKALREEIAELRKEVEEIKKVKPVVIHNHYHYNGYQTNPYILPNQPYEPWWDGPYKITCEGTTVPLTFGDKTFRNKIHKG